jgi:hypothetical protein
MAVIVLFLLDCVFSRVCVAEGSCEVTVVIPDDVLPAPLKMINFGTK